MGLVAPFVAPTLRNGLKQAHTLFLRSSGCCFCTLPYVRGRKAFNSSSTTSLNWLMLTPFGW